MGEAWKDLWDQASALFTRETTAVQFATGFAVLVVLALVLEGLSSLFFRRRNDEPVTQRIISPAAIAAQSARSSASSKPEIAKQKAPVRRRPVKSVRKFRAPRPQIKRTGQLNAIVDPSALSPSFQPDGADASPAGDDGSPEDVRAGSYDFPPKLDRLLRHRA